ncbi:MAG: PIN domain-containing protein [Duganella sp.]
MVTALFDTNILIDYMDGVEAALDELVGYPAAVISVINWMEVACELTPMEIAEFNDLLQESDIDILQTSQVIMVRAAQLRGSTKKKLPDCIIRATAETFGCLVVTRNPSDFGGERPMVRVPYDLVGGKAVNVRPPVA